MLLKEKLTWNFLVFLPVLFLPFFHLPFEVLDPLGMLKVKMLYVFPASVLILFSRGRFIFKNILTVPILVIFVLNLISFLTTTKGEHPFLSLTTLSGFIIAFYGIYKSTFRISEISTFFKMVIVSGVLLASYSLLLQLGVNLIGFSSWDIISGPFPNRNFFGGYMAFSFLFVLIYILKETRTGILLITCSVLIGDGLIFSETRGAWLAFLSGFVFFISLDIRFFFKNPESCKQIYKKKFPVFSLIIILILTSSWFINSIKLKPMDIRERMLIFNDAIKVFKKGDLSPLETTESLSVKMRYLYWRMAKDMILDAPLTGRGIGHFRVEYYPYLEKYLQMDQYKYVLRYPPIGVDNDFLEFWVEGGILNILAYISLIIYTYFRVYKLFISFSTSNTPEVPLDHMLIGTLLGGVTVIVSHGLFHYSLHDPTMGLFFWITTALIHLIIDRRLKT